MDYNVYKDKGLRKRPILLTVILIIAVIFAAICIIGVTLGSDSEKRQSVSQAVKENVELKQQMSEKDERISELEKENEELRAQIDAMPTAAPTPQPAEQSPTPAPTAQVSSPRG